MIGQFFIAVVLARLVGLGVAQRSAKAVAAARTSDA